MHKMMISNFRNCCLLLIIFGFINFSASQENSCRTPEGAIGNCVSVENCGYIFETIKKSGISSPIVQRYLRRGFCGYSEDEPMICCGKLKKKENAHLNTRDNSNAFDPHTLLPNKCGTYVENRIVGGHMMDLNEFPWLAVLEYEHEEGTTAGCGGSLITNRYVLTAGHCLRSIPSGWTLKQVRLGEYNLNTDPDCIPDGDSDLRCADPVRLVSIESTIVHESYGNPRRFANDIALLRLSSEVPTTNFIQPICLPSSAELGSLYWSAGWGQTEFKGQSETKLKVSLPLVNFQECTNLYATRRVVLDQGQFCAGGRIGRDTCKGDSGGPLVRQVRKIGANNVWEIDGVVSIGHSPCGAQGWPAVYTKVYNYLPWILSKLQP